MKRRTWYLNPERGVGPTKDEREEEGPTSEVMSTPATSDTETEDETDTQEEFCAVMERIKSEGMEIGDTKPVISHESDEAKRSEQSPEAIPESSHDASPPSRCRLCAIQNDDMVDIFGSEKKVIPEMIKRCLPVIVVEETDTLPKRACRVCLDRLKLCYQFNQIVAEAESQLLALDRRALIKSEGRDENCQPSPGTVQCGATVGPETEGTRSCGITQNAEPSVTVEKGFSQGEIQCIETYESFLLQLANPVIEAPAVMRKRRYNCNDCTKTFLWRSSLVKHMRIHTGERLHTCQYCQKKFLRRSNRDLHQERVHSEERPFKCSLCEKSFKFSDSMMDHKRMKHKHKDSAAKRCSLCDKAFSCDSAVERHMVTHTGEKRWQCDYCKKSFSRKSNLRSHLSRCKERTDIRKQCHKCSSCPKSFKSKYSLIRHYRRHTGKDLHSCKYCEKKFETRWKRDRHHLLHAGDRL